MKKGFSYITENRQKERSKRRNKHRIISALIFSVSLALLASFIITILSSPEIALKKYGAGDAIGNKLSAIFGMTPNSEDIENGIGDQDIRTVLHNMSEKNSESLDFVLGYEGVREYDTSIDLSSEIEYGTIPYFMQWDTRWGYCRYGSGLIGYTGCGPTCLSMVYAGLTGDGTMTPGAMAIFSTDNGYCVPGNGTAWALFSEGAEKLGLTSTELNLSESSMTGAIDKGMPIVAIMGAGDFTDSGHYILIHSYDSEGFRVYDPNCRENSELSWSFDTLKPQIKNLWAFSLTSP